MIRSSSSSAFHRAASLPPHGVLRIQCIWTPSTVLSSNVAHRTTTSSSLNLFISISSFIHSPLRSPPRSATEASRTLASAHKTSSPYTSLLHIQRILRVTSSHRPLSSLSVAGSHSSFLLVVPPSFPTASPSVPVSGKGTLPHSLRIITRTEKPTFLFLFYQKSTELKGKEATHFIGKEEEKDKKTLRTGLVCNTYHATV